MDSSIDCKDLGVVWPNVDLKAVFQAANYHSGGLLTCWDSELLELINIESMQGCLGITLKDVKSRSNFYIFIIYSPRGLVRKRILWDKLANIYISTASSPTLFISILPDLLEQELVAILLPEIPHCSIKGLIKQICWTWTLLMQNLFG